MDGIEGVPGELFDRLIRLLNCDALGEGGWDTVAIFTASFIGGEKLNAVVADTGKVLAPGTVGERMRQTHELVSRARYFELIRERLGELVYSGVDEAFLTQSLRDAVRPQFADVGEADRKRAETREGMA